MQQDQSVLEKPGNSQQAPTGGHVDRPQNNLSAGSAGNETVNHAAHHPSHMATTTDDAQLTSDLDPSNKTEGLLTDFAMQQLQLRSQPFIGASADGELFADELTYSHINEIRQTIINGDQLIMLVGELGAGKSTLLKQLTKTSGQRLQFFSVKGGEKYTTHNLFNGILNAWQLDTPSEFEASVSNMLEALQAGHERNRVVVLLLDDVDLIPARELNLLVASIGYFNADEVLIHMVMSAEPAFEQQIESLMQKDLQFGYSRINIEPMLASRAHPYIQLRLNQAGHFDEFPLTEKQVTAIANDASGLPGRINFLTAETLNTYFSPFGDTAEQDRSRKSLQKQRLIRYVLGFLALGLIVTGLLWKKSDNSGDAPFKTVAKTPIGNTENNASTQSPTTLQTVTEDDDNKVSDAIAETANTDTDTNNQNDTTEGSANAASDDGDAASVTETESDAVEASNADDAVSGAVDATAASQEASENLEAASKEISAVVNGLSNDDDNNNTQTETDSTATTTATTTATSTATSTSTEASNASTDVADEVADAAENQATEESAANTEASEEQTSTAATSAPAEDSNDSDAELPADTADAATQTNASSTTADEVGLMKSRGSNHPIGYCFSKPINSLSS